jgi:DNA-damage-inducible protein J
MGLSLSDAIRLMLVRVAAERALPFAVRLPNATTRDAMRAAGRGEVVRFDRAEAR